MVDDVSHDGAVVLAFAGSQYRFRLAIQHWQKLETDLNVGPQQIVERLHSDQWTAHDVQRVVLWGLVGGGMETHVAADMLRDFLDPLPMFRAWELATQIIRAGWLGTEEPIPTKDDDPAGAATPNGSTTFPIESSDGPISTGPAARSN